MRVVVFSQSSQFLDLAPSKQTALRALYETGTHTHICREIDHICGYLTSTYTTMGMRLFTATTTMNMFRNVHHIIHKRRRIDHIICAFVTHILRAQKLSLSRTSVLHQHQRNVVELCVVKTLGLSGV